MLRYQQDSEPMTTPSTYRQFAEAQGVARPFDILVRMEPTGRQQVANLLRCNLRRYGTPHAQAWRIINQNLRGLQARTHTLPEQLTPFSRNNNWWEILTRTARRIGVKFYPGMGEQEIERLLFERFAERFVQTNVSSQADAVDSLADGLPLISQVMASMRLSRDATLTVLSSIAMTTARADESLRDGCAKVAEWFGGHVRWAWVMSISSGLGLVQQKLGGIYSTWASRYRLGGRSERVCAALAVIYFQDLVDCTLDEFDRR